MSCPAQIGTKHFECSSSGQTEIHIYIVEMITKTYGGEETTRLLQAISAGLKFRFLVLEKKSPFTCENLSYPTVKHSFQPFLNTAFYPVWKWHSVPYSCVKQAHFAVKNSPRESSRWCSYRELANVKQGDKIT